MTRRSAGIVVHRVGKRGVEVLLVHPGGPFWKNRDLGAWSIPEGRVCGRGERGSRCAARVRRGNGLAARCGTRAARRHPAEGRQAGHRLCGARRFRPRDPGEQHVRDGVAARKRQASILRGSRSGRLVHPGRGARENSARAGRASRPRRKTLRRRPATRRGSAGRRGAQRGRQLLRENVELLVAADADTDAAVENRRHAGMRTNTSRSISAFRILRA